MSPCDKKERMHSSNFPCDAEGKEGVYGSCHMRRRKGYSPKAFRVTRKRGGGVRGKESSPIELTCWKEKCWLRKRNQSWSLIRSE